MTNSFMTTVELQEQYGLSKTLTYDWFDTLEDAELARRAPGRPYGTKLYSQMAVAFLLTRKGKVGSPGVKWSKGGCLRAWLNERNNECQYK